MQRAFRDYMKATREHRDEGVYCHVRSTATSDVDRLYREVLTSQLESLRINLRWIEVSRLTFGPASTLSREKASNDRSSGSKYTVIVVGSHGYCPCHDVCDFQSDMHQPFGVRQGIRDC